MRLVLLGTAFLVLTFLAAAQEPRPETCSPCPKLCGCPDDYKRKPCPAPSCLSRCGEFDDYCRKALPWIWRWTSCPGCDDYARKPCAVPCRPFDSSRYLCWPTCSQRMP